MKHSYVFHQIEYFVGREKNDNNSDATANSPSTLGQRMFDPVG